MKVLVVGSGGREHAVIKKLRESALVDKIYALPGNGGIAQDAECVPIGAMELEKIRDFAVEKGIGLAVVTPDDPLVAGAVDLLEAAGVPAFGPCKAAAAIEGSKAFAKELMKKYGIPTARYEVFTDCEKALEYAASAPMPFVVKADGLALGKGVVIPATREEALAAVRSMMSGEAFGDSGRTVVIEEFLEGPEVSVLAFTDGKTIVPMVSSMDHKRALDGDKGLNTGGMGTVAPNPYYTDAVAKECMERIFLPTVAAMNAEGRPFKGCLYFGLMITKDGPKVIEYNCRFGDPETQVVLPLLEGDLARIMLAVRNGTLAEERVSFSDKRAACVILASGGYPKAYKKGCPITIGDVGGAVVYHAGTKLTEDGLVTSGGRVMGVTAVGDTLRQALDRAYAAADNISFENMYKRSDIGARALKAAE
ncbi:MAG: phosphoribosylamine--glycine ligase [Clostridia bacterium]|nr:phosphoribosylamine--glycine ligase [Clostridia bacterium]